MGGKIMHIFRVNKVIERLNRMINNAIEDKPIENGFDESKMSSMETKLSQYLTMNNETKSQLAEEKQRIHSLISDISHQTKTPISNIMLYSQLLEESDLEEKEKNYVSALTEQAEKLNFLIVALVKTSRLESGIIAVRPKKERMQCLFDHVQVQVEQRAKNKDITLSFEPTELESMFDLKWTVEAIYNMVDNAIKYTEKGGDVTISAIAYDMFTRIDIVDTGMGIDEEETAKVFLRFYRSPQVSSVEGVGIGLYLSREIISSQGGYVKVNSKVGVGTTFSVFLPRE